MLGPDDVGQRVVVRRFVGVRENRPLYSDVLGQLTAFSETQLTIETAAGPVTVPRKDVLLAKTVPARRRATAREVAALEHVAARGWPPLETDRLGDWLLRAAGGWTNRANSALALGDPGRPLPAAIASVVEWYAQRDLPAVITTPLPAATRVAHALDDRGWQPNRPSLVQTARLADLPQESGPPVRLVDTPPAQWLDLVADRKGGLPAAARHILCAPGVKFAMGYEDSGALIAGARGVVTDDWLGVSLVEVVPGHRRRGWAGRLLAGLAGWAAEHGVTRAYLQVEERNAPALALYEKLGFRTHHRYVNYRFAGSVPQEYR